MYHFEPLLLLLLFFFPFFFCVSTSFVLCSAVLASWLSPPDFLDFLVFGCVVSAADVDSEAEVFAVFCFFFLGAIDFSSSELLSEFDDDDASARSVAGASSGFRFFSVMLNCSNLICALALSFACFSALSKSYFSLPDYNQGLALSQ